MSRVPENESQPYVNAWEDAIGRGFGRSHALPPLEKFCEIAAAWEQSKVAGLLHAGAKKPPLWVMGLTLFGRLLSHEPGLASSCQADVKRVCDDLNEPHVIVRLLLRAVLTDQAEERPKAEQSAWKELVLHGASPFGNDDWSRDRLETWLNAAADSRRRGKYYRILFPTAREDSPSEERGQLVWAEITVCPSFDRDASQSRLLLAPWTFFRPSSESDSHGKKVSWEKLCNDFPKAMGHICQSPPEDYLLALQPFGPEDLPLGLLLERLGWSTALAPDALEIGGPSLGVAVALAALAAATNRRVRPVVATGMIDRDGKVVKVGYIAQKLRAWEGSWANLADAPLFLYPRDNHEKDEDDDKDENDKKDKIRSQPAALQLSVDDRYRLLIWLRSLNNLKPTAERDFFTDGFDGYRTWVLNRQWPGPPTGDLGEQCKDLSPILAALYSRITEWTPDAATAAWQQEARPDSDRGSADEPWLYKITAWFDEKPRELALEVFRRLAETWRSRIELQPGQCYHDPVVLCVRAADLLGDGELPPRLARAVRMSCENWPGPTASLPSAEDFATALRQREGKIVLIVYDLKSLDLWEKIDDARGRLMRTLHGVAAGRDVCRQHVVLVFSDLHHQKWFEKECPPAATAAAAG